MRRGAWTKTRSSFRGHLGRTVTVIKMCKVFCMAPPSPTHRPKLIISEGMKMVLMHRAGKQKKKKNVYKNHFLVKWTFGLYILLAGAAVRYGATVSHLLSLYSSWRVNLNERPFFPGGFSAKHFRGPWPFFTYFRGCQVATYIKL